MSERKISGGDVVEAYTANRNTYLVAGAVGTTLTIPTSVAAARSGAAAVAASTPNIDKSLPDAAPRAVSAYAHSGRSVYAEALALGGSKAEAAKMARSLGVSVPSSQARPATPAGSMGVIGSVCTEAKADSNNAYGKVCVVQDLISTSGSTWYIGDKISASGNDTDWIGELDKLYGYDTYGSGNSIVEWNPESTADIGSCKTVTTSIGFDGIGISSPQTVCNNKLVPEFPTRGFGAEWQGCDGSSQVEGAPSVDLDDNGPGASTSVTAHAYIHWDTAC